MSVLCSSRVSGLVLVLFSVCLKKIPKYEILKFDMKIILYSLYFGIIVFTCKLKLDHYDDNLALCVIPYVAYCGYCWNLPQYGNLKVLTLMLYALSILCFVD